MSLAKAVLVMAVVALLVDPRTSGALFVTAAIIAALNANYKHIRTPTTARPRCNCGAPIPRGSVECAACGREVHYD